MLAGYYLFSNNPFFTFPPPFRLLGVFFVEEVLIMFLQTQIKVKRHQISKQQQVNKKTTNMARQEKKLFLQLFSNGFKTLFTVQDKLS